MKIHWKFWQKKEEAPKPKPIVLVIPDEHVQRIRQLTDNYQALRRGQDREAHYLMWSAIAEIFPQVREGSWTLKHPNALTVHVVQNLDKDKEE